MFNVDSFVHEMVRRAPVNEVDRAREELWVIHYDILQFLTEANEPIIPLPPNVVEVKAACIDQTPLSKTREIILDSFDPDWRHLIDKPDSYIWRGEQNHIRLFPIPDGVYEVWVIVQKIPTHSYPKFFDLLIGVRAAEVLSLSNHTVGRVKMIEYLSKLRGLFNV